MASSLQSKVQMLLALFAVFILLAVPLFFQVVADASASKVEAKDTALNKFISDVAKKWFGKDPGKLKVDELNEWQKQAQNCGEACDLDRDLDGDGMSTRDELEQGRNPNCNENTEPWAGYCAGQSKTPPTTPPPTTEPPRPVPRRVDVLFEDTMSSNQGPVQFQVVMPDDGNGYYDRWIVYWNATQLNGFGGPSGGSTYSLVLSDDQISYCCQRRDLPLGSTEDRNRQQLLNETTGSGLPPPGTYTMQVDASSELAATWEIRVIGVRDAFTKSADGNG